jgi:S1-C subfamily serine protease
MELATLTPRLGAYFGTDKGVLVVRAPAAGALKLEDGEVILSIDGRVPASGPHATRILASYQPGEAIHLEIMRERKTRKISTTMPESAHQGGKTIILRRGMLDAPPLPPPPRDAVTPQGNGDKT